MNKQAPAIGALLVLLSQEPLKDLPFRKIQFAATNRDKAEGMLVFSQISEDPWGLQVIPQREGKQRRPPSLGLNAGSPGSLQRFQITRNCPPDTNGRFVHVRHCKCE